MYDRLKNVLNSSNDNRPYRLVHLHRKLLYVFRSQQLLAPMMPDARCLRLTSFTFATPTDNNKLFEIKHNLLFNIIHVILNTKQLLTRSCARADTDDESTVCSTNVNKRKRRKKTENISEKKSQATIRRSVDNIDDDGSVVQAVNQTTNGQMRLHRAAIACGRREMPHYVV